MDNKWIPISERLPEKYGTYMVAWRPLGTDGECIKRTTNSDLTHYYEMVEFEPECGWIGEIKQCKEYEILAWQPLPQPYKEADHE